MSKKKRIPAPVGMMTGIPFGGTVEHTARELRGIKLRGIVPHETLTAKHLLVKAETTVKVIKQGSGIVDQWITAMIHNYERIIGGPNAHCGKDGPKSLFWPSSSRLGIRMSPGFRTLMPQTSHIYPIRRITMMKKTSNFLCQRTFIYLSL